MTARFPDANTASARARARNGGFTLLEIFVMVTIIATIAAIALALPGSSARQSASSTKLQADVVLLNQMLHLYEADGGSLNGASTAQDALDRLKRARPTAEAKQQAGVSTGRFIDVRLVATMGSGPLAPSQLYRAAWNTSTQQFELVGSGVAGVDSFDLDESLADAAFPLDTRQVSVKQFNSSNGWVWGNTTQAAASYVTPTAVAETPASSAFNPSTLLGSGTGGGSGGGSGGSGSGGGGGPPATPPVALPAPDLSPPGGSFAYTSFPSTIAISTNGSAPSGQFKTMYRVNGGAWQVYAAPIPVSSGTAVEAQNVATSTAVVSSSVNAGSYYQLVSGVAGSDTGTWMNPVGGSNLVSNITPGNPTTTFSHGDPHLDLGNGQSINAGVQNTLTFTATNFKGVQPNSPFTLGTLVMLNGTTFNNSEASGVTLQVTLNFTSPPSTQVVNIPLTLISTPNNSDRLASADIVQLTSPDAGVALSVGGVNYTLNLSWVSLDPSAGVVQGSKFLIFEGASATAQLQGTLVPDH